jgi:hypothetical protein
MGKKAATPVEVPEEGIQINEIGAETLLVPIVGTSPLLMHRFSEKSKKAMLDAMQGRRVPREPKDPEAEYEASIYRLDDTRYGFPAIAFKAATVGAARFYGNDVKMTDLRQSLFFRGEIGKSDSQQMFEIHGEPIMREDVVRVNRGGTDLRYRAEFTEWTSELTVVYVKSMLTKESVVSLIDAGGLGVGVGEWRPEKNGDFGTYKVDPSRDVKVLG